MIKVSEIFEVRYGVNLELNGLKQNAQGINFVSRTEKNNGVSAKVDFITGVEPIPAGTISVACGGSVMESFLQPSPYYSGRDLYYLNALIELTDQEKLYYCACLRENKYRFNYGRQANRTLKDLLIPPPENIPYWVNNMNVSQYGDAKASKINNSVPSLDVNSWKWFSYDQLFEIERGRGPRQKDLLLEGRGTVPFITSIDSKNGLTGYTTMSPCHEGNTIGVNRNGSVGEAFYQPFPFCSTEDVHIFKPKFELNIYQAMFLITLIRKEQYRFNYGRKWGIERMKKSTIKLPVKYDGTPDWEFMEHYIKTLPFSSQI